MHVADQHDLAREILDAEPSLRRSIASLRTGDALWRRGDVGDRFALVVSGTLLVASPVGSDSEPHRFLGPGSIVGELALLTERPRTHTLVASENTEVAFGDTVTFTRLLDHEHIGAEIRNRAAERLAEAAPPVPWQAPDGTSMYLRPLLPTDRAGYIHALQQASAETLMNRFFSGGPPPLSTIDYLLAIDYERHFAWVAVDSLGPMTNGLGIVHYFRNADDPSEAEIALAVADHLQGKGLGRLLVGAIGVAARHRGIDRLVASVLPDNVAMHRVFDLASAVWSVSYGVSNAAMVASDLAALVDPTLRSALERNMRSLDPAMT